MIDIELMQHQVDGANWLSRNERALLYWDMGVGKTFAAIRAHDFVGGQLLILCPAVARRNWAFEIKRASLFPHSITVVEKSSDKLVGDIIICSYDLAARQGGLFNELLDLDTRVVILDELQYLKNYKSRRTACVFGGRQVGQPRQGIASKAKYVWSLSGTPAPNNAGELFPWVRFASPHMSKDNDGRLLNYHKFIERYCLLEENHFGVKIIGNNKKAIRTLWDSLTVDRINKDILNLPPVRFTQVEVAGDKTGREVRKLETAYRGEIDELLRSLDGTAGVSMVDKTLATLRRITEMAKVGDCIDIIKPELIDGQMEKVVIFANHIDVIRALEEGLQEFNPVSIYGAISPAAREGAIYEFQNNEQCRVFIGQTIAAGTAITLHADGKCRDVVFVSADWVTGNNAQAAARVHRKGQTGSVLCRFLNLANSCDEIVTRTLIHKARMLSEIYNERKVHHAA